MKVLLVNGSPKKKGCTFTALSEIESTLKKNGIDSEIFWIGNKPVAGCIDCRVCFKTGKCFRDDLVNEFIEMVQDADGFIFGSPVYYASANGSMISFMDRVFFSCGSALAGKPAAAIASCRRSGSTATFDQLNKYFTIKCMPVVSSNYWNMVHGNTPEEVKQDLEGLQIMRTLGMNMAWLLKCIDAGKKNGVTLPEYEEKIMTNFIR